MSQNEHLCFKSPEVKTLVTETRGRTLRTCVPFLMGSQGGGGTVEFPTELALVLYRSLDNLGL